jgi:phage-related protein
MPVRKRKRRAASRKGDGAEVEAVVRVSPALRDQLKVYSIQARPKLRMREAADQALRDFLRKHGALKRQA